MLNCVQIIGNLGRDAEIRQLPGGDTVAQLSVAVSESWKDKNTGERREKTEWVRVSVWPPSSRYVEKCDMRKGDRVYVEGQLETRKWTDKDGNDKYQTEVVVRGFSGKIIALGERRGRNDTPAHDGERRENLSLDDDIPF